MSVEEVIGRRQLLLSSAKGLIDLATAEKRELTAEEVEKFDTMHAEAETIHDWLNESTDTRTGRPDTVGGQVVASSKPGLVLSPEQRMQDLPEVRSRAGDFRDVRLGEMICGMATGRWEGREAEQRALSGVIDSQGGYTVPTPLASKIIDLARNASCVIKAGASTVPMSSRTLAVPKLTGDPTAYWRAENESITEGAMTFGSVEMEAKTLAAYIKMPIELVEDSPLASSAVENAMASALSLELDRVAMVGTGAGQEPLGILGQTGVTVTTLSAALTLDDLSTAVEGLRTSNEKPNAMITSPGIEGYLDRLKDGESNFLWPDKASGLVKALTKYTTGQVPETRGDGNDGMVFIADWSKLLIGSRQDMRVVVSRETGLQNLQIHIAVFLRADIALARPAAFAVLDDCDLT